MPFKCKETIWHNFLAIGIETKNPVEDFETSVLIKALTTLVGRLSLSVGWEIVLNGDFRLFHLILNFL